MGSCSASRGCEGGGIKDKFFVFGREGWHWWNGMVVLECAVRFGVLRWGRWLEDS